ncbi:MAG: heat-inducible transcriptional repressor HrcA [Lachnospiraceae bacterium]|nr:heat-inducible transcriptional repressor HrcA [Lachnospiraceae bacterium]
MKEELDERKVNILLAVIKNYLETGEPVGSRTISKFKDFNLSSATIRNEMADLEELGYLIQPHTSAGRIPSDKGYRFYVDALMEKKEQEVEDMKNILIEKADKMENLLEQVTKYMALSTNYTALASTPVYRTRKVKFIQLTAVDIKQLLAVIVIEGNIIKNKMIATSEEISQEAVLKLNILLNTFLQGLDLSEINLDIIKKIKEKAEGLTGIVSDVLDAIAQAISEEDKVRVYASGVTNVLKYPELTDNSGNLIYALEEKKEIAELMKKDAGVDEKDNIQVYIGDENQVESMKDCSVVTATYELSEGVVGKIGIVGPKRMDYEKVVSTLKTIRTQLDDLYKK